MIKAAHAYLLKSVLELDVLQACALAERLGADVLESFWQTYFFEAAATIERRIPEGF